MPYVRCGKCVYKGHTCEDKGKKVGCSDSIEKAKKYLAKLQMEASNENIMKITKNKLIQLIKEELEVILTDDEVKEIFDINLKENSKLTEAEEYERTETVPEPALQRPVAQPELKKWLTTLVNYVSSLEKRIEALEAATGTSQE